MKRQEGFSIVLVLVIAVLLIVGVSAGAYYFLKLSGKGQETSSVVGNYIVSTPSPVVNSNTFNTNPLGGVSSTPLSNSDTTGSLLEDLNNTKINSPEGDIQELTSAASSL